MPHQTTRISMLASMLIKDQRGNVVQTTTIPWPKECEELVETTNFLGLQDRAKALATRARPALDKEENRLKTDTLVGIRVSLHMAGRGQRAPSGFKAFKGFEFTLEELEPAQAIAAE